MKKISFKSNNSRFHLNLRKWGPLLILFALIVGVWCLYFYGATIDKDDAINLHEVGDSFGALNTLFSGLAFAAFIYTINLQLKEIGMQRQELELQREELKLTRLEMVKSVEAQKELVEVQKEHFDRATKRERELILPQIQFSDLKIDSILSTGQYNFRILVQLLANDFTLIEVITDSFKFEVNYFSKNKFYPQSNTAEFPIATFRTTSYFFDSFNSRVKSEKVDFLKTEFKCEIRIKDSLNNIYEQTLKYDRGVPEKNTPVFVHGHDEDKK